MSTAAAGQGPAGGTGARPGPGGEPGDPAGGGSVPAAPADELGFRLSRLARALRRRWTGELAPLGLSPPQAVILRSLAAEPGAGLRALARTLGSDPMNIKRCVDGLEARGLVASGSQPRDRRPRTLRLTGPGRDLAREVSRLARQQDAWLAGPLGPRQRECLEQALDRLEALTGAAGPPAPTSP